MKALEEKERRLLGLEIRDVAKANMKGSNSHLHVQLAEHLLYPEAVAGKSCAVAGASVPYLMQGTGSHCWIDSRDPGRRDQLSLMNLTLQLACLFNIHPVCSRPVSGWHRYLGDGDTKVFGRGGNGTHNSPAVDTVLDEKSFSEGFRGACGLLALFELAGSK